MRDPHDGPSSEESDSAEEKKDAGGSGGDVGAASALSSSGSTNNKGESAESEMRGVHCKTALAPNTVCVAVPRKCLITVEMGQSTPIGQAIL